ncbi:MAG TPA: bifunctional metallophosphatase/5'-nucleotidase [Chitinophagaceae bacterium]|nr:bifunctional metallophosphatase/5'-nucleotidase [Chitinophagaceae bacterium]
MKTFLQLTALVIFVSSCVTQKTSISTTGNNAQTTADDSIRLTILQINDFYEIAPLENGRVGGAARIATIRKKLLAENPNTLTVLAGDFLSPSLLGTLKLDGERIKGKHMVDVLNLVGIDLVTFGNHEFDIDEQSLQKRINESKFDWVSTNVLQKRGDTIAPFYKEINGARKPIDRVKILTYTNAAGQALYVGIAAPCLPANKVDFVHYEDIFESVERDVVPLSIAVDLVVLLSHLEKKDDVKMGLLLPEIDLILGGHDHDNMKVGWADLVITKADANAKTVYVHRIAFHPGTRKHTLNSELVHLNESVPLDPEVDLLVQKWKGIENKLMRDMGFNPEEILIELPQPYDARESVLRNQPAEFCRMICRAMSKTVPTADASIMNSGSVRVDDILSDKLSQYDVLRSLPFGGGIAEIDIKGKLLEVVLNNGWANKGTGGFLQWDGIERTTEGNWLIGGKALDPEKIYHIAITDFLLTGLETGLSFLTPANPEITKVTQPVKDDLTDIRRDIRLIIVDYLENGGR